MGKGRKTGLSKKLEAEAKAEQEKWENNNTNSSESTPEPEPSPEPAPSIEEPEIIEPVGEPEPEGPNSASQPFNPLDAPVKERDYTGLSADIKEGEPVPDLGEPEYSAPSISLDSTPDDAPVDETGEGGEEGEEGAPKVGPNPALEGADDATKKKSAETLVDLVLYGYGRLHNLARWYVKITDNQLEKYYREGKLAPELKIPTPSGKLQSLEEFVGSFNQQIEGPLSLTQEFIDEVRPAMIRVFLKHGWGLTDEQLLLFRFGEDIAIKASMVYKFKSEMAKVMRHFSDYYMAQTQPEQAQEAQPSNGQAQAPASEAQPSQPQPAQISNTGQADEAEQEPLEPEEKEETKTE